MLSLNKTVLCKYANSGAVFSLFLSQAQREDTSKGIMNKVGYSEFIGLL